jgi:hypothetical protein
MVAEYEDRLGQWRGELQRHGRADGWNRPEWWATIRRPNPRLRPVTCSS